MCTDCSARLCRSHAAKRLVIQLAGTKRDRVKLIGNAVPPWLAAHVVGSVMREVA